MGKTILISSHILHELAELCDTVGIIEQGKLLYSGSVSEIMEKANVGQLVHISVDDRIKDAGRMLMKVPGIKRVELIREKGEILLEVLMDSGAKTPISELASRLVAQGYQINTFRTAEVNLETAFMRLTKGLVG